MIMDFGLLNENARLIPGNMVQIVIDEKVTHVFVEKNADLENAPGLSYVVLVRGNQKLAGYYHGIRRVGKLDQAWSLQNTWEETKATFNLHACAICCSRPSHTKMDIPNKPPVG